MSLDLGFFPVPVFFGFEVGQVECVESRVIWELLEAVDDVHDDEGLEA